MKTLLEQIKRHLELMTPVNRARTGAKLLESAAAEIERLRPKAGRIFHRSAMPVVPDGTHACVLPGGFVLLNPTQSELMILEIYATEHLKNNPDLVLAEATSPASPASHRSK